MTAHRARSSARTLLRTAELNAQPIRRGQRIVSGEARVAGAGYLAARTIFSRSARRRAVWAAELAEGIAAAL